MGKQIISLHSYWFKKKNYCEIVYILYIKQTTKNIFWKKLAAIQTHDAHAFVLLVLINPIVSFPENIGPGPEVVIVNVNH